MLPLKGGITLRTFYKILLYGVKFLHEVVHAKG